MNTDKGLDTLRFLTGLREAAVRRRFPLVWFLAGSLSR